MRIAVVRRARRAPSSGGAVLGALLLVLCSALPAAGQAGGRIEAVISTAAGAPLAGAEVRVEPAGLVRATGQDGRAVLAPLAAGEYTVVVHLIGYRDERRTVRVGAGETVVLRITLADDPIRLDALEVAVLRPDLRPATALNERGVAEANAHDPGTVVRSLPGLDAVRRGALGLDPVVRGLRETQLGVYVDGARSFPGGPGGMDTPLSHVDPSAIKSLEVIKGPYALTWGAGNMSAIRVETLPLPGDGAAPFSARVFSGYDSNLDAAELGGEAVGMIGGVAYALGGSWRRGDDYTTGGGAVVPATFRSGEARTKLGLPVSPNSRLVLAGSLQAQRDIAYPGRPLDAEYFDVLNGSARWELSRPNGALRGVDALVYAYSIDHEMNNDGKPTARPDPARMPPFALDIDTYSGIRVYGGRLAAQVYAGRDWRLEVGGDVYHASHDARRRTDRRDTGEPMSRDLIWGGARIADAGLFARAERTLGIVDVSAAVRIDRVWADADSASAFFRENVTDDLEARETNLSGALTAGVPLGARWRLSAGLGSVARTADANERYSDRNPARKMQIGAEFMGDPSLKPERSTQVDLWIEASYPRLALAFNVFGRRIDDHITIEPTELPRRSAMSAPTVYRYVNGEATYWGTEVTATLRLPHALTFSAAAAYLYGRDETLDEPAFGVPPLRGDVRLRWEPGARGLFVEGAWRGVARQDRAATARGEKPTPGYTTLDVQGGIELSRRVRLRAGVNNLTDEPVINHLNATNPFTGERILEPGRVAFVRADLRL